jgi:hypothetical protein
MSDPVSALMVYGHQMAVAAFRFANPRYEFISEVDDL